MSKRDRASLTYAELSETSTSSIEGEGDVFRTPIAKRNMPPKNARKNLSQALKNKKDVNAQNGGMWSTQVEEEEMEANEGESNTDIILREILANRTIMQDVQANQKQSEVRLKKCEDIVKNCPQVKKEVEALKNAQKNLEGKTEQIKRMIIEQDYRQRELNIIIKGVPIHPNHENYKETTIQTEEMVGKLLKLMRPSAASATMQMKASRFGTRKAQIAEVIARGDKVSPMIKLTLLNNEDKESLYKALGDSIATADCAPELRMVQFQTDYPNCLVKEVRRLNSAAWRIRVDSKKATKTRVDFRNGEMVLLVKEPGELHYRPQGEAKKAPQQSKSNQQQPQNQHQPSTSK